MSPLKESYAVDFAIELAKIVCANPNSGIALDQESAQKLVAFIQTVSDGLSNGKAAE